MKEQLEIDGKKITIVGTAHVSESSVREVRETIENENPDFVGVELDEHRLESLRDREGWRDLDIREAIREGRGPLLLTNLILAVYQRRIGLDEDVEAGSEMLEAVEAAEEMGIEFEPIDRDISDTLKELRSELSLLDKSLLFSSLLFEDSDIEPDQLKESDMITEIVNELEEDLPVVKDVMLDRRNRYMAQRLKEREFDHAVVVVGAAHVEGLKEELRNSTEKPQVDESFRIPWMKMFKYGLPAAIIFMLAYSFINIGFSTGADATRFWILSNGILAALGAIAARARPSTWAVSFISAPLTSLYPALGAGMVAAYYESMFFPPSVEELEDIVYIDSYRELWGNQAGRILLILVFVSLGSIIASLASAGFIASLIAGV